MAIFCIPKHLVDKIKNSALSKEADIAKLYSMTSQERRAFFTKVTDVETGKFINTKFEKAMVSQQKDALLDWAQSVFSPVEKTKPVYKNILDKINTLQDEAFMSQKEEDIFLEDLVTEKLGISISKDEMKEIITRAKEIQAKQEALGENLHNPEFIKENVDFYKSMNEMNKYLQSRVPSNTAQVLMGTIGRGMMLFSLKSPVLNIGSNILVGSAEATARRMSNRSLGGGNTKLALSYIKMARAIYSKTGFDISRMQGMQDLGASGERVLGETVNTQGKGAINATGRIIEDIVFKNLMGAPDAFFASVHFADSINIQAKKYAQGDKAKAKNLMIDAMRVNPKTDEGKIMRAQGILDAQFATWTNDSWAAKATTGVRKIFNDANKNLRIGDYLFPFVKTPANVIATGLDYAGVGAFKSIYKLGKLYKNKDLKNKQEMESLIRDAVRAGLGLVTALMLAINTDDDDFVGAYDPKRTQIEGLRNSRENSIRIGDTWVSTDWLGPVQVAYTAMMYARKYGQAGTAEKAFQYGVGTSSKLLDLPVISDVLDFGKDIYQKKNTTLSDSIAGLGEYTLSQAGSRLIPSFFSDLAKAMDSNERVSTNAVSAIQAKVPWLRNMLPVKKNIFGEDIATSNAAFSLLFGARVRTSTEDALIKELSDVSTATEKSIAFTDWSKSSSSKLEQFRGKVGDQMFKDATIEYGKELKKLIQKTIKSNEYKKKNLEDRLSMINNLDTEAQSIIFKKYNFKYKTQKR